MPSRTGEHNADRETPRSEAKERRRHHRSSRTKRNASKESLNVDDSTAEPHTIDRPMSTDVPELSRRETLTASPLGSRTSLPYPSFSKAHSREAVNSREDVSTPARKNLFTPDPTDLQHKSSTAESLAKPNAPPSPPLTAENHAATLEEKRRTLEREAEDFRKELDETRPDTAGLPPNDTGRVPSVHRSSPLKKTGSRNRGTSPPRKSHATSPIKKKIAVPATAEDSSTLLSGQRRSRSTSPASSAKTSIAPQQPKIQTPFSQSLGNDASVSHDPESPKTPTPRGTPFSAISGQYAGYAPSPANANESPMPPPPPPPPHVHLEAPRVDYLMQNGGLSHAVTKHYLLAADRQNQPPFTIGELPDPTAVAQGAARFFQPFNQLLDDYTKAISKNGSIAVATGYRSIARRLLDRLEAVFARDISSETCACLMCLSNLDPQSAATDTGVSWGEILEYVSGRQELPQWPPFMLNHGEVGLGISAAEITVPMQKLDIDVPEEYREHYIRQSKKTKQSVDRWLAGQTDSEGPPDEADDDTLTFAILTHLDPQERPLFSQLLGLPSSRPPSTNPDPQSYAAGTAGDAQILSQTGLAIQRLYRLPNKPRLPECAFYLLKNLPLHNVLATLAAVSDGEWDILISGRFDGFLRSGANDASVSNPVSPAHSRGPTPAVPQRSASGSCLSLPLSMGSTGAPVALDEETEIATLAEVEREIFQGMEALEDAFEALHVHAEAVRRTLRERGAGLAMQAQARKGAGAAAVEARLGTPASARGWESETDDGIDDALSEIAPDDSASNVSRSRIRRRRRTERRTPAPVEEENEEEHQDAGRVTHSRHSMRKR